MARAKLHIICGNCGRNDLFLFRIDTQGLDMGDGTFEPEVFISCRNCGTLHSLNDTIAKSEEGD